MKKPVIDRNRPLGLYLHIPFCKAKCAYCDFYSLPHSEEKMDAYAAALARHGVPYELHVYPYGDHGLSTCDHLTVDQINSVHHYDHAWLDCAKKWLRLQFSGCAASKEEV